MENKFYRLGHRFILASLVSLFLCSTLLFFGPLNLYLKESDSFWFSFQSILTPVIIIFSIAFVICTIICTLAPKQIIHKIFCALVFGIGLALFIQGNFANIKYGSGILDGSEIVWEDYTTYGAIDCGIWAACIALPFALVMVFKKRWRAILITASVALVVVQALTFTTQLINNKDNLNKSTCEVQSEGMYELSDKNNTLVFVLDAFDQSYYDDLLETHPDYKEKLEGFTEYNNTLAAGGRRIMAFSSLISGNVYKKDAPFNQYIDDIWSNDNVYRTLDDMDVDTRIYADTTYFSSDASSYINNIVRSDEEKGANEAIVKTIYKYTLFNYSQHYLKPRFWLDRSVFDQFKSDKSYERDDAKFYNDYLENDGFTYTDKYDNTVRIYSLEGTSEPYTLKSDGNRSEEGSTLKDQADGCFTYMFDMIEDLKDHELFDKTNIIIVGNCGEEQKAQQPVLLIKKAGDKKEYQENKAPISLIDFPASLSSLYINNKNSTEKVDTFFNIKEKPSVPRTRYYYLNTGSNADTRVEEYKTTGAANDIDKLELTKLYYTNNGVQEKYQLGKMLSFTMDATANQYCTEGFRGTTGWRTPLCGNFSQMVIPIKSIPLSAEDLHVYFGVNAVDIDTTFSIYANGMKVYTRKTSDSMINHGINFTVPTNIINKDKLLTIDFKFDNIPDSELEESIYDRTITISFNSFKIYTQ